MKAEYFNPRDIFREVTPVFCDWPHMIEDAKFSPKNAISRGYNSLKYGILLVIGGKEVSQKIIWNASVNFFLNRKNH